MMSGFTDLAGLEDVSTSNSLYGYSPYSPPPTHSRPSTPQSSTISHIWQQSQASEAPSSSRQHRFRDASLHGFDLDAYLLSLSAVVPSSNQYAAQAALSPLQNRQAEHQHTASKLLEIYRNGELNTLIEDIQKDDFYCEEFFASIQFEEMDVETIKNLLNNVISPILEQLQTRKEYHENAIFSLLSTIQQMLMAIRKKTRNPLDLLWSNHLNNNLLHLAIQNNHHPIVEWVLHLPKKTQKNFHTPNFLGKTPMYLAAESVNIRYDILNRLIQRCPSQLDCQRIDPQKQKHGWTPLVACIAAAVRAERDHALFKPNFDEIEAKIDKKKDRAPKKYSEAVFKHEELLDVAQRKYTQAILLYEALPPESQQTFAHTDQAKDLFAYAMKSNDFDLALKLLQLISDSTSPETGLPCNTQLTPQFLLRHLERKNRENKNALDLASSELTKVLLNRKTTVQDSEVVQDFNLKSLTTRDEHSQKVKASRIPSDFGSKDCVNLPSSTAVSRLNQFKQSLSPPTDAKKGESLPTPGQPKKRSHSRRWWKQLCCCSKKTTAI